jgi:subtilase family serine protease
MSDVIQCVKKLDLRTKTNKCGVQAAMRRVTVLLISIAAFLQLTPIQAAERRVLRGSMPRAVAESSVAGVLERSTRLHLMLGLPLHNQDKLTVLLKQLSDPTSPNYHRYLTPDKFNEQFAPTDVSYQELIRYAKSKGFLITGTHFNRAVLEVSAAVADAESAFNVHMMKYQSKTGRSYYAPDTEPSVDADVEILGVGGLSNFALPQPAYFKKTGSTKAMPRAAAVKAGLVNSGSQLTPLVTGSGPGGYFIGNDYRAAYAEGVTLTGAGQTIALVEFDGFFMNDFESNFLVAGLPVPSIETELLEGFNGNAGGWNGEVTLDMVMAGYMAPGADVIVYEGVTFVGILNRIATEDRAQQISCSWTYAGTPDPLLDQIFLQFAAQGQSFLQASGDTGAYYGDIPVPADNPNITVVGGTSLTTVWPGGPRQAEAAWVGWGAYGSGGGRSTFYQIPDYQQGTYGMDNGGSSYMRNIPDVSIVADGQIFLIFDNGNYQGAVYGTSAAAPLWAGFIALANQEAAENGRPQAGFLNPRLYFIGKSANYPRDFRDIVWGYNNGFNAVRGYDLVTGWGSPIGQFLIDDLVW